MSYTVVLNFSHDKTWVVELVEHYEAGHGVGQRTKESIRCKTLSEALTHVRYLGEILAEVAKP